MVIDAIEFFKYGHDRRFKVMAVSSDLLLDFLTCKPSYMDAVVKIKNNLPADVRVQAMRYEPMRDVLLLRLWSSEWPVLDMCDTAEEITVLLHFVDKKNPVSPG